MWDPLEAAWERGFAHFEKLSRDANGYRTVAQRHVMKDGYRLGHWHDNQRQAYKRGTLKTDRIQRLEEAGMVWDSREMAWEEGLDHFVAFDADSMGERRVPQGFVTADGFKLGWWLDTQRRARRRGALSEARIGQLEASGIVWDPQEMAWEIGLAHFLALPPDELGRRMVPQTHTTPDDGFKLGWWQHAQSAARKRGELSDERIARLDAAGFVWDRVEAVWDDAFAQFKALPLNAQGLRTVPQTLVVHNELRLGRWADSPVLDVGVTQYVQPVEPRLRLALALPQPQPHAAHDAAYVGRPDDIGHLKQHHVRIRREQLRGTTSKMTDVHSRFVVDAQLHIHVFGRGEGVKLVLEPARPGQCWHAALGERLIATGRIPWFTRAAASG